MRVDVIGPGYAGTRLIRSFEHAANLHDETLDVHTYTRGQISELSTDPANLREAFAGAETIINATSDDQHLGILNLLTHTDAFVLSEKPLIAPWEKAPAQWASKWGRADRFALNCIERYSPLTDYVRTQIRERGLRIARIDFTWAKNRFDDPRPTVGIVSEIIHPLDLCCYLTGIRADRAHLLQSAVITSDYTSFTDDTAESVQIMADLDGVIVTGYSSFAHPDRRRAFDITLVCDDGRREYIKLAFDDPGWDRDWLRHVSATGAQPAHEATYVVGDGQAPPTCGKLSMFAEDVLWGKHGRRYVHYGEAAGLHTLLAQIQEAALVAPTVRYGRGPRRATLDRSDIERLG